MMLKKFYGSSIQEARKNAREVLGSSFIVVETKEATANERAWIHVMDDSTNSASSKDERTYSQSKLLPKAFTKIKETVNEGLQLFNEKTSFASDERQQEPSNSTSKTTDRSRLQRYNRSDVLSRADHTPAFPLTTKKELNSELTDKIEELNNRFDRLENLIDKQMTGPNVEMISHPAFQQLLASGVPHLIISRWFCDLLTGGIDPYNQQGNFTQLLAKKVKQSLDIAAKAPPAKYMIFTGASGSGKSSLMMKLALDSSLLGDASFALATLCHDESNSYFSPLSAFAYEHEISHYKIEGQQTLQKLNQERENFDHILIEMPQEQGALNVDKIRESISDEDSLEVHHVVNAALNQTYLNTTRFSNHSPRYIDFTHLDQVPQKGHLLPIMQRGNCQIRYVTNGTRIPDDISTFDPASFAKQLLTT